MSPLENSWDLPKDEALLLAHVAWEEDFEDIDSLIANFIVASVVPGCCRTCRAITTSIEPDQDAGWCHNCKGYEVQSVLILAGAI